MEINKMHDVIGVVTNEAIPEGRMVLLASNITGTYDFGSRGDLPGVKLPDDSTEAGRALYTIAFSVDNRSLPVYEATPAFTYALRDGGFDQASNVPFSATVHLTHPGNKIGQTIPSGALALAYEKGVFTVPSGAYVYNASLETAGARLIVANAADDTAAEAGKLKYSASGTVAVVERFNSSNKELTYRVL